MTDIKDGYYWLVLDRLRYGVVLVRGKKYYPCGSWRGRKLKDLPDYAEFREVRLPLPASESKG